MLGYGVIAATLGALGLALIFASWRRWIPGAWHPACVGWLVLSFSALFWVLATGAEFGITLALLVPSVIAWMLVLANRRRRHRRGREDAAADKPVRAPTAWPRHLLLLVVVVPLAAVASTLTTVALSMLLPWQPVNAMLVVMIAMPMVWGCGAYWACADSRPLRPATVMAVAALVSGALIYV